MPHEPQLFLCPALQRGVDGQLDKIPGCTACCRKSGAEFLGDYGGRFVAIAFVVSAIGALNGSILSNARVPYAMARDGLFFPQMAVLHSKTRVPVISLLVQGLWACVLALSGTFDQLTDCLLFASWIFYGLVTSAVFVLRRKMPEANRPYKTFGYPIIPLVFVSVALWLIINTLYTKRVESLVGLGLILIGIPLYLYYRKSRKPLEAVTHETEE